MFRKHDGSRARSARAEPRMRIVMALSARADAEM
jgi:hypothetical protein